MRRLFKSPLVRLSFGLAMLTVSMLLITDFIGLVPNTKRAEIQSRKVITESLAVQLSKRVVEQEVSAVEEVLRSVVERNDYVLSAAVRTQGNVVLAQFGGHDRHWILEPDDKSTPTHIHVPLFGEKGRWGSVELSFKPLGKSAGLLSSAGSFTTLVLFMALAGFLAYMFFLKRAIRELNPDSVIPERVRQALDTLTEGLLILDKSGFIVFSNAAFARKVGISTKRLVGKAAAGFDWVTDSRDSGDEELPWNLVLEGKEFPKNVTLRLKTKLKKIYTFTVNASPITGVASKIRGVLITFNDITEIEAANQELRRTLEKLEHSQKEVSRQSEELEVIASNDPLKAAASKLKVRLSASRKAMNAAKEDERNQALAARAEEASEENANAEPDQGQAEIAEDPFFEQTQENEGKPQDSDVTPNQVSNNVLLFDRIDQSMKRTQRHDTQIALLVMDVDTLQAISGTLGHVAEEKLTKIVITCLKQTLRLTDTVTLVEKDELMFPVSRLDTNEIVILLTDLTQTEIVTNIIQRIFSIVEKPVEVAGREVYFSVSVGVSLFPLDGGDPATLINNASSAMQEAKQNPGRNSFHFYAEEINQRAEKQIELEAELRHALEQDELIVYYQPKVDLKTGKILGMEALVRWQHPRLGVVPPNEFISVAEHTGLIGQIDLWVIRAACQQMRQWQEAGHGTIPIAVNLSPVELRNRNLADQIIAVLDEIDVPPSALELEITETVVMQNVDLAVGILDKLSNAGLSIAVDDFGTGYSSLSYLKRFPLDKVKIDRSFISDFVPGSSDAAITRAIIAMGHSLGLRVVAEGVETEEQMRFLQDLHCDEAQGHLISKPVPIEGANELLARFSSVQRMIVDYWENYASLTGQQGLSATSGMLDVLNDFSEPHTEPLKQQHSRGMGA